MTELIALASAGALGALSRYGMTGLMIRVAGADFPYGTLTVNTIGSFVLGFLTHVLLHHPSVPPEWRAPIMSGFLGSFTTFSSFSVETVRLFDAGNHQAAMMNVALNLVLGMVLAALGLTLGRAMVPVSVVP